MRSLERYNRRLQRRHPLVRVRWSDTKKAYVLEEKAAYARADIDPAKYPSKAVDTFIQHRDGYTPVEYFRRLPEVGRLGDALNASRVEVLMSRAGAQDVDTLAERLDAEDEARREARSREFRGNVDQIASSEYDRAMWRTGSRVVVPALLLCLLLAGGCAAGRIKTPSIEMYCYTNGHASCDAKAANGAESAHMEGGGISNNFEMVLAGIISAVGAYFGGGALGF